MILAPSEGARFSWKHTLSSASSLGEFVHLQLAVSFPQTRGWVTGAPGLWCCYLPSMEYGMQECAWNQLLPQKKKSPECSDKPKAYKCTQLVSSKAGKHQASLTVLDLGYPRDRIKIPVWEVLGRFTKLELWGGHRASIFLQVHSYEYFSEERFQFFPTLPTEPHRSHNYILNNFSIYSRDKLELHFGAIVIITFMEMCCLVLCDVDEVWEKY